MSGVNSVFLIGRLGQDPELKYMPKGDAVCNFSLATSETWTKDGEKQEKTQWHRVIAWRKLGEVCGQYLKKGREVCVRGKIEYRTYDDKDGNKRYITEITAENVQFLGGKGDGGNNGGGGGVPYTAAANAPSAPMPEDDLPF